MALTLTKAFKPNKHELKYFSSKEYSIIRCKSRANKKILIQTDENLVKLFDWIFETLKTLGFYSNNSKVQKTIQRDDIEVGKLLGISGEMVKRYRIRAGYIPTLEIINKIKELELLNNKAQIKITRNGNKNKNRITI